MEQLHKIKSFDFTVDYPMLVNQMLVTLYTNRLIKDIDVSDIVRLGYYIDPKLHPLAWEICCDAWVAVWNDDEHLVQAITNAIYDWDC